MNGSETDDLFDHLVQKQAGKEFDAVGVEPISDAKQRYLGMLFTGFKEKGRKISPDDLAEWQGLGIELPTSLVIFAAFMQGTPLPFIEDPEVRSEPLGELGACFYAGSKLFGFHDAATGCVHLPANRGLDEDPWADRIQACSRFSVFFSGLMSLAHRWGGCTAAIGEDGPDGAEISFVFEGAWAGDPVKTVMDQFMRYTFSNVHLVYGIPRLERVEFEVEMRKAFGKM